MACSQLACNAGATAIDAVLAMQRVFIYYIHRVDFAMPACATAATSTRPEGVPPTDGGQAPSTAGRQKQYCESAACWSAGAYGNTWQPLGDLFP